MFTGIITALGRIAQTRTIDNNGASDLRVYVSTDAAFLPGLSIGSSIAVNGVCLTATELPGDGFWADISHASLSCTSLGQLAVDAVVNLESALTPNTALDGHFVSGHVDAVARIIHIQAEGRSTRYTIELPATLKKYLAIKGSIAVDGVSLTVNTVSDNDFAVNIVPHTLQHTIFQYYTVGSLVNLEVDIIARYLERLLQ